MKITQISVFLENKAGRLLDVCSLIDSNDINIRALTIAESENFGVLRMVVDQPNAAVKLLQAHDITANLTDVTAVEVDDKPGSLTAILKVLTDHDVNVEYMYGFTEKSADKAILVFRFDDTEGAQKILADNNIKIVTDADIRDL